MTRSILFSLSLLWVALGVAQVPSYVPANNLAGWWPFNGNGNDESGYDRHLTVTNCIVVPDRNGVPSSAYDVSNGSLSSGYPATTNWTDSTSTISFWINAQTYNGLFTLENVNFPSTVGCAYPEGHDYLSTRMNSSGFLFGHLSCISDVFIPTADYPLLTTSNYSVSLNAWHHIVVVNAQSEVRYYVDGVLRNSQPRPYGFSRFGKIDIARATTSGTNQDIPLGGVDGFAGVFDDLGVWSRTLSDAEVAGLYTGSGVGVTEALSAISELRIFPNPGNGLFILEHSLSGEIEISVFDIVGRKVQADVFPAKGTRTQYLLDLSNMTKGSYRLKVQSSGNEITRQLIIE